MKPAPCILGIDPGSRYIGMVLRCGPELVWHLTSTREDHEVVWPWVRDVAEWAIDDLLGSSGAGSTFIDAVAHELVAAPNPHLGMTNAGPAIQTAYVGGVLSSAFQYATIPSTIVDVPPDGHGAPIVGLKGAHARAALLQRYPAALVGPRETTGAGKSPLQHARAAWDVAGAAAVAMRTVDQLEAFQGDTP